MQYISFILVLVALFGLNWGLVHGICEVAQNVFGGAWEPRWQETWLIALIASLFTSGGGK